MPASHMKEGDARQHMKEGDAAKIAKKWDEAVQTFVSGGTWHQHPLVVSTYKNRLSAGSINFVEHLKERYGVLDKCISIGCGDGGIVQEMVIGGLCKYMRGIDLSPVRVKFANDHVPDELRSQLEFHVQNAETDLNEQEFDMVLFTHALHHIFDLESMSSAIKSRVLKPGGILVLEEYVGPVRWQFPPSQLTEMELFLTRIESKYPDRKDALRQNPLWDGESFVPPDAESIRKDDPSETVRSNEIIPVLGSTFELVENVQLGGTFFQWIFHNCYNSLKDSVGYEIISEMLSEEMRLINDGSISSDYVFQVWK